MPKNNPLDTTVTEQDKIDAATAQLRAQNTILKVAHNKIQAELTMAKVNIKDAPKVDALVHRLKADKKALELQVAELKSELKKAKK